MADTLDALSSMSGLTKDKIHDIWEGVKANNAKLDECPGPHRFTIPAGLRKFADDFICEVCGGKVDGVNKVWYEKGLEHGRQ